VICDAVIVPGGGVREGAQLPAWVPGRFDLAIERSGGGPIVCLSAGTVHRPNPLDETGRPLFEASAGAQYLLRNGVSASRIYIEAASWDTVGNAYFARTIHTDPRGWRKLLVITSDHHMPRTEATFRWVFGMPPENGYSLSFESVPDVGFEQRVLEARRERERASLAALSRLTARFHTLAELHQWLFTEHDAYKASLVRPETASGLVSQAY
jgi:uncharacterized SAM-binding protein YcdF (DUF218 family)